MPRNLRPPLPIIIPPGDGKRGPAVGCPKNHDSGGGPNRIGQGIEFDYCCVHASFALKEMGIESIMVNSNPETVSTDYDTSDKLYFEPLTHEDVLHIVETEKPDGVIVQFGGQTPLNLALPLMDAGFPLSAPARPALPGPKTGSSFRPCSTNWDWCSPPTARPGPRLKRLPWLMRSAFPLLCGRPMCWAVGP